MMLQDIEAMKKAGLVGVVLGVQNSDGALDVEALDRLRSAADGLGTNLHRVIDVVPDQLNSLEEAIVLGFDRVLTSGAAPEAPDGLDLIKAMVDCSSGRISIMPDCGLTPENGAEVVAKTAVFEVHAACTVPVADIETFSDFAPPRQVE